MVFPCRREATVHNENDDKEIDINTYEARLKRLKEELMGLNITEIIEKQKLQEKNQTFDNDAADIVDESKTQRQANGTSPSDDSDVMPLDSQFDRER